MKAKGLLLVAVGAMIAMNASARSVQRGKAKCKRIRQEQRFVAVRPAVAVRRDIRFVDARQMAPRREVRFVEVRPKVPGREVVFVQVRKGDPRMAPMPPKPRHHKGRHHHRR